MKLEVGKFYKTRDGVRVGPLDIPKDHGLDGHFWIDDLGLFTAEGLFGYIYRGTHLCPASNLDLISEWTDTPTIGTLAEIGAQVGDVVECVSTGCSFAVCSVDMVEMYKLNDYRIVSRGSDLSKLDYKTINVEKPIYEIEPDKRPLEHFQSGSVITETVKRIVPGVYGKVYVFGHVTEGLLVGITDKTDERDLDGYDCATLTRADLIAARDVFNQLIDAMPDIA